MKNSIKKIFGFVILSGIFFSSCNKKTSSNQNQETPEQVVELVFEAAKTKNFDLLTGLCDPQGESDGDVKDLCDLKNQPPERQKLFIEYFSKGGINGKAIIGGDHAEVKIKFGPDGTKDETFKLVRRDGKWYLGSF